MLVVLILPWFSFWSWCLIFPTPSFWIISRCWSWCLSSCWSSVHLVYGMCWLIWYIALWWCCRDGNFGVAWWYTVNLAFLIQLFLLGVMPFLVYIILLCNVNIAYSSLIKTIKLIVFIFFMVLFPVVIVCFFVFNVALSGLLGVLVLGVYFVYIVSWLILLIYVICYFLLLYDMRLVILGILPIIFMFLKIMITGFLSLIFLYVIILVISLYL